MSRLPSLFVSHGAPNFALESGLAGPRLTALGATLPRPQAVLVVSPDHPHRRAELTTEPERYAAYTREYLGWGVFALMAR